MGGSFSAGLGYEAHSTEATMVQVMIAAVDADDGAPLVPDLDADGNVKMMRMGCMGSACDPTGLRYGATLSIDQIAIGGSVYDQEGQDGMGGDRTITDVGISWTQGPLMLGIQHGSDDKGDADHLALNVNYNLGPGVDVGAKIGSGESGGNDYTQFLLGTMFNF